MKCSLCLVGLLLAALVVSPNRVQAAKANSSLSYDSRSLVTTLWYPDDLAEIRGVIVFTGGAGSGASGDTRGLVNSPFWQRFAASVGFGLLGNQFTGSYANAAGGTGQALLDSLVSLATSAQHPELLHAPLLLEGFSNGGYFSFTFAQFAPSRVIAFCVNKSGFASAPLDAPFLAVPGLLIWGSQETVTVIHALVQQGRLQHALWAEVKEWGVAHQEGSVERIFAPFFADMISARYPAGANPVARDVPLIALSEASGWLGDHSDQSLSAPLPVIAPSAAYGGDRQAASWLPNQAIANLWRGFVTQTPVGLDAPSAGAQLDANQPLQLSASGLGSSEHVSFFAGSTELVASVATSGGQAKTTWIPRWGGTLGMLAFAVDSRGAVTRTSRPVEVVLYGKPSPVTSAAPVPLGAPGMLVWLGLLLGGLGLLMIRRRARPFPDGIERVVYRAGSGRARPGQRPGGPLKECGVRSRVEARQ